MISGNHLIHSVVVPVYNSAPLLTRLYARLVEAMESIGQPFELIFVDDGSTDASWIAIAEIAHSDWRVIALQLAQNAGQGRATLCGIGRSAGEIVITLDDDLQHAPEDVAKLLASLNGPGGYDAVFGVPVSRHHPAWRRIASWILNLVLSLLMRKPLSLRFTGFCAMRRSVALQLLARRRSEPFLSVLLFQITPRIGAVPVEHSHSKLGASRYSAQKLSRVSLGCLLSLLDCCLPADRRKPPALIMVRRVICERELDREGVCC